MNSPTLRDLYDQIVFTGPNHFDMAAYLYSPKDEVNVGTRVFQEIGDYDMYECGTVGCIAGHGANLMAKSGMNVNWENTSWNWNRVANHFGIPHELFLTTKWDLVSYRDGTLMQHYYRTLNRLEDENPRGSNIRPALYTCAVDWLEWELKNREN